jgi:hypothetical protein
MKNTNVILRFLAICATAMIFYIHYQRLKNFVKKSPENFAKEKSSLDYINDTVHW